MTEDKAQVLVCQHGARHRYAIARMLEDAGMLAALFTDSSDHSGLGRCSAILGERVPHKIQRLARRKIEGVPREKVFSSDTYLLREYWQKLKGSQMSGLQLYIQRHRQLSKKMQQWGVKQADVVYSMYHENLDFVRWAKSQGLQSVVDVFISPLTNQVMDKEAARFPDWGHSLPDEIVLQEQELWFQTAKIADLLLCPSEWVASGIRTLSPEAADKIRIIPYGCSVDYQGRVNSPMKGRVLFAGGVALRKGLHYLAQAATRLKNELPDLDVRIAGSLPTEVTTHPIVKDLNFLGKLNLEQMKEEYLSADIFVLPSLSEGFAGVVAEAIAAGCPVIVTMEAGSPVVDEREGLVVPSGSAEALSEAIKRLTCDRSLRSRCSENCIEQTKFYTENEWQARILDAISSLNQK